MDNAYQKLIPWLNKIDHKEIRDICYLLCVEDLKHPLIEEELYYPIFDPLGDGQFGLEHCKKHSPKELKTLSDVVKKTALGRYTERLMAAWFRINPKFDLLDFNLQLIKDGLTIGEIDFLLWEKLNQRAIHLEFALKFFLAHKVEGKWKYTGPKGRDTLAGKSRKLVEHQLRLSDQYKALLPSSLSTYNFQSKLMIKGAIFYPIKAEEGPHKWLRRSEFESSGNRKARYRILDQRVEWIYPFDERSKLRSLDFSTLNMEIKESKVLPLMVVVMEKENKSLMMIVEDSWPAIH